MQVPVEPEEGVFYSKPKNEIKVVYFGTEAQEVTEAEMHLSKSVTNNDGTEYYIRVAHGKPYDKDLKIRPQKMFVLVEKNLFDMYHRYCASDNKNILLDLVRIMNLRGLI